MAPQVFVVGEKGVAQTEENIAAFNYEPGSPKGTLVLLHDIGFSAKIWDVPRASNLARYFYRKGFRVISLNGFGSRPKLAAGGDDQSLTAWENRLNSLSLFLKKLNQNDALPRPIIALGHGFGGTMLMELGQAKPDFFDGYMMMGAPIARGSHGKWFQAWMMELEENGDAGVLWGKGNREKLEGLGVMRSNHFRRLQARHDIWRLEELIGEGYFSPIHSAQLPGDVRERYRELVPFIPPDLKTNTRFLEKPILIVTSPGDYFAPPWLCDPNSLGIRFKHLEVLRLTRANGFAFEYGHLEMILHKKARREVYPRLLSWLDDQS